MDLGHTSIVFGNIVDRAYFGLVSANSDSKFGLSWPFSGAPYRLVLDMAFPRQKRTWVRNPYVCGRGSG